MFCCHTVEEECCCFYFIIIIFFLISQIDSGENLITGRISIRVQFKQTSPWDERRVLFAKFHEKKNSRFYSAYSCNDLPVKGNWKREKVNR